MRTVNIDSASADFLPYSFLKSVAEKYTVTTDKQILRAIDLALRAACKKKKATPNERIAAALEAIEKNFKNSSEITENFDFFIAANQFIKGVYIELYNIAPDTEAKAEITELALTVIEQFLFLYSDNKDLKQIWGGDIDFYKKQLEALRQTDVPPPKAPVYFKNRLSLAQQKCLIGHLKQKGYTTEAVKFVDVLKGKDILLSVNPTKLPHIAYLLFQLYTHKYIELSVGKGYMKAFESHIFRFSQITEKRSLTDYKQFVTDKRSPKANTIKEIEVIIASIKSS